MNEQIAQILIAGEAVAGLAIFLAVSLRGWNGWLELKRLELSAAAEGGRRQAGAGSAGERIEMADLKERIRKLESLAASIDL
jgi:hypothetical protein